MYAPDFIRKVARTRKELLGHIAKQLQENIKRKKNKTTESRITPTDCETSNTEETLFSSGGFGLSDDQNLSFSNLRASRFSSLIETERVHWLEPLTDREWKLIESIGIKSRLDRNQAISKASDPIKSFYKINAGQVREVIQGKTIRVIKNNIFAPHLAILDGKLESSFICDARNTEITIIEQDTLHKFFELNPLIGKFSNIFKILNIILNINF
jgi:hypothetical protein